MEVEVKDYTYETMPEYTDPVDGAEMIEFTGRELGVEFIENVVYAHKDGHDLHLNIFRPFTFQEPQPVFPCILFIQGSAWKEQNLHQKTAMLPRLAEKGYVIAVVEYRHSGIAHFPAQILDAKDACRYMQKYASMSSVNPDEMIFIGDSSGGQVALIAGMSAKAGNLSEEVVPLEGLEAILSLYGAMEVTLPYAFPTTLDHQKITSPEGMMMGFDILENSEEGAKGNALSYVDLDFPPVFLTHGTKDKTVFAQQSVNLYEALKKLDKPARLVLLKGADHGGPGFWKPEMVDAYDAFIRQALADDHQQTE